MKRNPTRAGVFYIRVMLLAAGAIACLSGFVPGGKNHFVNASRAVIKIEYVSTSRSYLKKMPLARGSGLTMSGDTGELLSLTVKYSDSRTIRLDAKEIARRRGESGLNSGVWWITDDEIRYISHRDANILRRKFPSPSSAKGT